MARGGRHVPAQGVDDRTAGLAFEARLFRAPSTAFDATYVSQSFGRRFGSTEPTPT
jgi:hypothetical protein